MAKGKFTKGKLHIAYNALLFYTGVMRNEARRATREQFWLNDGVLYFDVGKRQQSNVQTDPLMLSFTLPYVDIIWHVVEATEPKKRVFPFSDKTAYNIVQRVFKYPSYYRFNRVINLKHKGKTTNQIRQWTGLSPKAIGYYTEENTQEKINASFVTFDVQDKK